MQPDRYCRLSSAIRGAVRDALDGGMPGRDIIKQLDREAELLRESLPLNAALGVNHGT